MIWLVSSLSFAQAVPSKGAVPAATSATKDLTWAGLQLGVTDEAALDAWVAERGLQCEKTPSPRRETIHVKCSRPDPTRFGEAASPGVVEQLLIVRTDSGPVHHVSIERVVPEAEAAKMYLDTVARLRERYGVPARSQPPPPSLDGKLVMSATDWRFTNLDVRVNLVRIGDNPLRIGERWDLPGVENAVAERPGSVGAHSGKSSSARNPHLED